MRALARRKARQAKTRDLLLLALFGINALAETIKVPQDCPLIQAGINGASEGDTVLVSPGRYVETINSRGKAITVTSTRATRFHRGRGHNRGR